MFSPSNHFRLPNKQLVTLNNNDIVLKPEVKFLGIYITDNLKWNVHVLLLCSSFSKVPYIVKSLKAVFSPYMLRSIYFSYFNHV